MLFGRDVGAGFVSAERSLCALGPDGSAEILVAGDSRAKLLLDPLVLDSITGRKTINVAEMVNFGGDLPTLVNVLRKYPRVLEAAPVLIISVSVPGINDLDLDGLTAAAFLNWTPMDHAKVAVRTPARYPGWFFGGYLPYLKRHLTHKWRRDEFACSEEVGLPPGQMASRGFRPDTHHVDPSRPHTRRIRTVTRDQFLLDGARRRLFDASLLWLAQSPARAVLLYNAPMLPEWRADPDHAVDMEMEARFATLVSESAARHAKVVFLDFVKEAPPELAARHFADNYHLNREGAALFTRRMGRYLIDRGWADPEKIGKGDREAGGNKP